MAKAKLIWDASVICFDMDEQALASAKNVPLETRQYLQAKKFQALDKLRSMDPADTSRDSLVLLAKMQAQLDLLDEILLFLSKSLDFGEN